MKQFESTILKVLEERNSKKIYRKQIPKHVFKENVRKQIFV